MDIVLTILLSSVKFGMTFPLAVMEFRFSFFETILWINIGGLVGIYFFAFLSKRVNRWIEKRVQRWKAGRRATSKAKEKKKIFTRRNRRIIRIKQRYGLIGIAATTPLLLSIPVGVFLVIRYYPHRKMRYLWLVASNLVWSFIYTSFYMFWKDLLFT